MLFVERSNRTERLLEGLAERLMAPGRDPLAPGVVVVQGPGMERWIAQSIAREYGVCANTAFLFPRSFLERVFEAIPDEHASASNAAWEVRNLTWRIAKRLAAGRDDADFAPLARHLDAVDGDWRLVQLATRIANLLDQYVTFRPDWVEAWARSSEPSGDRDARWQVRLFREILAECGGGHVADRARAFRQAVAGPRRAEVGTRLQKSLPDAVEIFAVSALPPLYLGVIDDLARIRDVRLSVLSPTRHYWAELWREVKDEAERDSLAPGAVVSEGLFAPDPLSPAATLLASLGRLGADFQRTLEDASQLREDEVDRFESPRSAGESQSLLRRFQSRLLDLDVDPDPDDAEPADATGGRGVSRDDDSIRVHLCHGPRRELEVVESLLREAFDRDATLRPEDVIVMAPRIDEIAPDIEAVFGGREGESDRIPFRIADRGIFRRSPVAEAFRGALGLLGGRAERSEVLDWVAREPVRARFGLDEAGVESLSEWAGRAGIRFGYDESHREDLGLPRERAHTWDGGLDRLVLAHAVGHADAVLAGSVAVPLDAFADPGVLGSIGEILSVLSEAHRQAAQSRSVEAWCRWLRSLLDRCVERTDANAHEHASIRSVFAEVSAAAVGAGFDEPIPFEAIRERVDDAIEKSPTAEAFLAGGITFCELVPLRAIPFRVIVLLGMVDDAFPRGGPPPGFDLTTRDPRPGDRTPRSDDRYLFLEALLSARDQLVVTVPAFDMRDGAARSPSVVVADLVDTLDALFDLSPEPEPDPQASFAKLRDWLVVGHPLRASSARYFEASRDPRLVNRDAEAFAAALARREANADGDAPRRRFLAPRSEGGDATPIAASDPVPTLALDTLITRFLRSSRFFAREHLQLRLPRPESAVGVLDPVELDDLVQHGLGNAMLDRFAFGPATDALERRLHVDPTMPCGVPGRVAAGRLREEVETIARIALARRGGERREDVDFDLALEGVGDLGTCRIVGRLDFLFPGGRVVSDYAKIGRRSESELWIRHLVLSALADRVAGLPARSVLVGRPDSGKTDERVVVFERADEPIAHLGRLFESVWRATEAPLPFFQKTSRAFASKTLEGKPDQAWRNAYQIFEGGDSSFDDFPESMQDLDTRRIWEGWSPLESRGERPTRVHFDELATQFFAPLLAARRVERS